MLAPLESTSANSLETVRWRSPVFRMRAETRIESPPSEVTFKADASA
ncbi:MAG: hypothetical protein HYR73_08950 [Candidatus Eisenbacteria bacterium]|nr:hypothetical protein [Candidatus Eisenbacteria bacterium]